MLLSSVKFAAGPPFAYYDNIYDFTFFETNLYCVLGGMLGVTVIIFLSHTLAKAWRWIVNIFKKLIKNYLPVDSELNTEPEPPKRIKIFTRRNRRIVKVWKDYGLIGIAFITPVILSIPIGTFIATRLSQDKRKLFIYMFFSIVFWSVLMTSLFELYQVVSVRELEDAVNQ